MDEQQVTIVEPSPSGETHRLYRSRTDRQVAGVCGGLGEYLGFDPTLIRIAWLVSIIFAGVGLFAYLIAAVIIPEETRAHAANKAVLPLRGAGFRAWAGVDSNRGLLWGGLFVALGILLLLGNFNILPLQQLWNLFWTLFWPMVLIGLGVVLLLGITGRGVDWRGVLRGQRPLVRRRNDRVIAGVCGGLADFLGIDASVVRIVWAIGSTATLGLGVMVYVILLLVMPEAPDSIPPTSSTVP
jgi:phage shock protein PspC (stress-responsive transcriptional regulator)